MIELDRFPRRYYTDGPTPIQRLKRLSAHLGGPDIYIKRDDLLGLAAGGNKTRKLEFLVADALAQGADTLITCGAPQSNHCRLTASAAAIEGLRCQLVLQESTPGSFDAGASGNVLLDHLLGVEKIEVVSDDADLESEMHKLAQALTADGRKPYAIPIGGSNPIGATGYVACGLEILDQISKQDLPIDRVICASGSGGTQAGLVTALDGSVPVIGINVSRSSSEQEPRVHDLVARTATHLGAGRDIPRSAVRCLDEYVGPGYAQPTAGMIEAVELLARHEGILLDPVYSGKAMAGLIDLVRQQAISGDERILFLHTGGSPALYAYAAVFRA